MTRLRIDHAIYAVGDLDAAGDQIYEREGLASVPGGRHEGWGTANRIVPLGETYLELIAVVEDEEAESSDFGRAVLSSVAEDRPLLGWVVATDDIEGVAERLDLEVESKSRDRADGSTLRWRLAGLEAAMESGGVLPFFIEWEGPPEHHPGAAEVRHDADVKGIAWVEVCTDDEERLRDWLGDEADLPVRVREGDPAVASVAIETDGGEVVFH
jgi:hypothetical protein